MKPIEEFTIKPKNIDYIYNITQFVIGSTFVYILYQGYLSTDYNIAISFLLFVCIRVFFYAMIDLSLPKKIYIKNNDLYIKCLVSWKVNFERCYLKLEQYNDSTTYLKHDILVLCRNNNTYGSRFFKNKIKLRYVNKSNIDQVLDEAKLISNMFGIRLWDFDITDLN